MRTTRLVMLAPFRGRRRSRDRRSPPSPGRPTVVSPLGDEAGDREGHRQPVVVEAVGDGARAAAGRRGSRCRRRRPRRRAPRAREPGRDPGDPVGFLVAELARAAESASCRSPRRRPGTGSGSRRSPPPRRRAPRSTARSGADRTTRSASGSPHAVVRAAAATVSSMSAPIARRMSMMARRVGFDADVARGVSSASGWIAPATSQNAAAETIGRDRSRRSRAPPPAPSTRTVCRAVGRRRLVDRRRPAPAASAPCGRASRPPRGPSSRRRPAAPASRIADLTWALGHRRRRSVIGAGSDRPVIASGRRVAAARPCERRAHRAQRLDDTGHRPAAERGVAVEDREQRQPGEHAGDEPQARPGVAAVEDARRARAGRRRRARRRGSRRRPSRVARSARRCAPSARDEPGRRADVLAVAGRRDPALARGEQREQERPVADRLVAGQARARRAGARPVARRATSSATVSPRARGLHRRAHEPAAAITPPSARTRSPWRSLTCSWTAVTAAIICVEHRRSRAAARRPTAPRRAAGGPRP